jgi:hypothetical protein
MIILDYKVNIQKITRIEINNTMRINHFIITLIFFVSYNTAISQQVTDYENISKKYTGDKAVMLQKKEYLDIKIDHDTLAIQSKQYIEKYFLSDKAGFLADHIIFFNSFVEIKNLSAFLYQPKGKKFKKNKVNNIRIEDDFSGNTFFGDSKTMHVSLPKIDAGYRSTVSYEEVYSEPRFLGSFYFSSYIPVEKAEFSVSFPENVKIKYKIFNDTKNEITFRKSKKKRIITYTWESSEIDKYEVLNSQYPISYYQPHIVIYIDEYEVNGKITKVLTDTDQLYSWYYNFTRDLNQKDNPKLADFVDSLTRNETSDIEKIRKIFYWVQDNINYVAFEDGYSGFIPSPADDVFHKRYADCKGMASILTQMLTFAEITAHFTWIGTRRIPYSYSELPTPLVDNHMIAAARIQDEYVLLDATGQYMPLFLPPSSIQGKEALIGIGEDNYTIYEVPVVEMEKNVFNDSILLNVENDLLIGNASIKLTGYEKYNLSVRMNRTDENKLKELLEAWLEKGSNKFKLNNYVYEGLKNKDDDLIIDYQFEIPDYINSLNDTKYINLHIEKTLYNNFIDTATQVFDHKIKHKSIINSTTTLEIPKGYELSYIPENVEYSQPEFGLKFIYTHENSHIKLSSFIYINTLAIKLDKTENWNNMINICNDAYNQTVALKKIK